MLCVLVIVLSDRLGYCKAHNLAIDLARVQHVYSIQPPPSTLPVVEGMAN